MQHNRFIQAEFSADDAALLIKRGVWLGTVDASEQTIADISRYHVESGANVLLRSGEPQTLEDEGLCE